MPDIPEQEVFQAWRTWAQQELGGPPGRVDAAATAAIAGIDQGGDLEHVEACARYGAQMFDYQQSTAARSAGTSVTTAPSAIPRSDKGPQTRHTRFSLVIRVMEGLLILAGLGSLVAAMGILVNGRVANAGVYVFEAAFSLALVAGLESGLRSYRAGSIRSPGGLIIRCVLVIVFFAASLFILSQALAFLSTFSCPSNAPHWICSP